LAGSLEDLDQGLLDLGFFVDHVFTRFGIVFLEFQFTRRGLLVLVCGVEMAGVGGGNEADFVTHGVAP
jgi:hypothetical protein